MQEREIEQVCYELVRGVLGRYQEPYFREAAVKTIIKRMAEALVSDYHDVRVVADQLEVIAEEIREREADDD